MFQWITAGRPGLSGRQGLSRKAEQPFSQFIPFSVHLSPSVVSCRDGSVLSVWQVAGRSFQSASLEDVFAWLAALNNLMRGIAVPGIVFYSHLVRRRVLPASGAASSGLPYFCRQLDDQYRDRLSRSDMFANDLYLTILRKPAASEFFGWLGRQEAFTADDRRIWQAEALQEMESINATIGESLKDYGATLLAATARNGHLFSPPMEVFSYILNGQPQPVPLTGGRFADVMMTARPFFATWGETGALHHPQGRRAFSMLEIREYPETTEPGHLNGLLSLPFELVLTNSFSVLSRPAARGFLQRHQRMLEDARDVAVSQIEEISEALDGLVSGRFVMGEHHCTVLVHGDTMPLSSPPELQAADRKTLEKRTAEVVARLQDVAIVPKVVDLALEAAFVAQLPGAMSCRPRPAPVTSLNFLCFSSFHNFMSGRATGNPWGEAVALLKTPARGPFWFSFHAPESADDSGKRLLGNTVIFGQSGSGKTVLLGFLLAQAMRFQPTIVVFDKDRGMELFVRALGGTYLPLKTGEPSGFNPFQLEPSPAVMAFLRRLLHRLVSDGGEAVSHQDEQELDHALQTVMFQLPRPLRRLSTLLQSLPDPAGSVRPSAHARLRKWCQGGPLGWLFDNENDDLSLDGQVFGFDVTEFIDSPDVCGPLLLYLTFRTESLLDGRRFIYVFDEFWKALSDPCLEDLSRNKQKTIRKQNGIFLLATQEPGDAIESPIARTLIQQCATMILLPNPKADYADYVDGLKLTPAEYELVRDLPASSHQFLVRQGSQSGIAMLDLQGLPGVLAILSGTPDRAAVLEQVLREGGGQPGGSQPEEWLPVLFSRLGLDDPGLKGGLS